MHPLRSGLLGLAMVGLGACGSTLGSNSNHDGGGGGGGPSTTGTGGATGGGGAGGAGPGTGGAAASGTWMGTGGSISTGTGGGGGDIACVPGIPATTQLRRMTNREYDAVVRDLLGVTTVPTGMGTDARPPSALLFADFDGPMTPDAWRTYQDVGAAIAKAVMANSTQRAKFISCDPATSGCLASTITTFGRKAYRRPLTDAEVARFTSFNDASLGTPDEIAQAMLLGFLVSPPFLMVPEMTATPAPSGQGIQLSSHEVAARLSFMLWGSVGDDALNAAADGNQLLTKDQILAQAQRMVAMRDKAAGQVSAFHRHWARMADPFGHWWTLDHDVAKYPLFTPDAKTASAAELDSFFAEVAFTNGSYKDLLLSNVGFVNKDNAAIYGLTNTGTALTKVQLDPVQRPGFLTRAGFLSSYSHYAETAPLLRGAFIMRNLIGIDTGPPLPAATMLPPPAGDYKTNRQKNEAIVNQAATCMGCHTTLIDPPGFVLENYDAIGKWQTTDPLGGAIDPVADVTFSLASAKKIQNAQELMQELARTPKGMQLYARALVSYGFGREPNPNDQCVADDIGAKLVSSGYPILNALADLAQADSFRLRVRGQ